MDTIRRYREMRILVAAAAFIVGFYFMSAANVHAWYPTFYLRGEYHVVGSHSCVNPAFKMGFTNDGSYTLTEPEGSNLTASFRWAHYDGFLHLYPYGKGKFTYTETEYISIFDHAGEMPMESRSVSCDVVHTPVNNGLFAITLSNCASTWIAGIGQEAVYTFEPKTLSMAATRDGEVLVLSNTYPEVEYFTRSDRQLVKMCSRTFTGVRQSDR